MKRETFVRKKEKELAAYGERLRKTYKRYARFVRVQAETTNRAGREKAAGKAVLQALDVLCQTAAEKPLVRGGLNWRISEEKSKDGNGRTQIVYEIGFSAVSSEREFSEEQIAEELKKTWEKMDMEIQERFPEAEDEKQEG